MRREYLSRSLSARPRSGYTFDWIPSAIANNRQAESGETARNRARRRRAKHAIDLGKQPGKCAVGPAFLTPWDGLPSDYKTAALPTELRWRHPEPYRRESFMQEFHVTSVPPQWIGRAKRKQRHETGVGRRVRQPETRRHHSQHASCGRYLFGHGRAIREPGTTGHASISCSSRARALSAAWVGLVAGRRRRLKRVRMGLRCATGV